MNAINFIKLYGLHSARVTVEDAQENTHYCTETGYHSIKLDVAYEPCPDCVYLSDLKRLVESVDYVLIHGHEKSKEILKNAPVGAECYSWSIGNSGVRDKTVELVKLKQAIADYEAIYKCTYCNGFGEVGCQFEGTFTCPDCNGDCYVGGKHDL